MKLIDPSKEQSPNMIMKYYKDPCFLSQGACIYPVSMRQVYYNGQEGTVRGASGAAPGQAGVVEQKGWQDPTYS